MNPATHDPLTLTVMIRAGSGAEMVERYYPDCMPGGMFIRTEGHSLLQLGRRIAFRFVGGDRVPLFGGVGLVAWIQRTPGLTGIGIQFEQLDPDSAELHRQMVHRRQQERDRGRADRPECEFFDAPTSPYRPDSLFVP